MNKNEIAVKKFNDGFNCAQSVFSTYCTELGLDNETALRISTSFGGGMGHTGETCGAVTGALMVIGLKYGRIDAADTTTKEKNTQMVKKFASEFRQMNGSLRCTDILGIDLSTEEGLNKAKETGLTRTICPKFIKDSCEILERILEGQKTHLQK